MKDVLDMISRHKGEVIGGILGLLFALFILLFGFFKTLFIILCIAIGIFVGGRYFEKKKLIEFLDKHLPW